MTTALLLAILATLLALAALSLSFHRLRRSRDAIRDVDHAERAPRLNDLQLRTRGHEHLDRRSFEHGVTLLVTLPTQDLDAEELTKLISLRERYPGNTFRVLGVPVGATSPGADPSGEAGELPVLAPIRTVDPGLEEIETAVLEAADRPYTKLLVDAHGRIVSRFSADTDPRSAEIARRVEELLAA